LMDQASVSKVMAGGHGQLVVGGSCEKMVRMLIDAVPAEGLSAVLTSYFQAVAAEVSATGSSEASSLAAEDFSVLSPKSEVSCGSSASSGRAARRAAWRRRRKAGSGVGTSVFTPGAVGCPSRAREGGSVAASSGLSVGPESGERLAVCLGAKLGSKSDESGYCYLLAVVGKSQADAVSRLGSWPVFREVMQCPVEWFEPFGILAAVKVSVRGLLAHVLTVGESSVGATRFLTLCRSFREHCQWVEGSLGEAVAGLPAGSCAAVASPDFRVGGLAGKGGGTGPGGLETEGQPTVDEVKRAVLDFLGVRERDFGSGEPGSGSVGQKPESAGGESVVQRDRDKEHDGVESRGPWEQAIGTGESRRRIMEGVFSKFARVLKDGAFRIDWQGDLRGILSGGVQVVGVYVGMECVQSALTLDIGKEVSFRTVSFGGGGVTTSDGLAQHADEFFRCEGFRAPMELDLVGGKVTVVRVGDIRP